MRMIEAVHGNKDKQHTYKEQCLKHNKAVKEEFYCEAILISYAMIEDRLRSFLYYIGALEDRNSEKVSYAKTKAQLKAIVLEYKTKKENERLEIKKISGKITIIRCTLEWAADVAGGYKEDKYLSTLKKQYEGNIDIQDMQNTLKKLSKWLDYRNEIVHGLLNKNIDNLNLHLKETALQGMMIARKIDSYVRQVKKGNYIRRSVNLCTERNANK